jgi:hypothetical protein
MYDSGFHLFIEFGIQNNSANFRTFPLPPKEAPYHLTAISQSLYPFPAQNESAFCFCGFVSDISRNGIIPYMAFCQ